MADYMRYVDFNPVAEIRVIHCIPLNQLLNGVYQV